MMPEALRSWIKFFLTEPHDSFYEARRKRGTLVVSACPQPEETCFCSVFGIDCAEPKGDAAVWPVGEELYWKTADVKGGSSYGACPGAAFWKPETGRKHWKKKRQRSGNCKAASLCRPFFRRVGRRTAAGAVSFKKMGGALPALPWPAVPAPLYVPPVNATILRIMTRDRA